MVVFHEDFRPYRSANAAQLDLLGLGVFTKQGSNMVIASKITGYILQRQLSLKRSLPDLTEYLTYGLLDVREFLRYLFCGFLPRNLFDLK